jgi:hypothetical protein
MLSMLARNAELMALARAPSDQRLTELKLGA